jgi:dephospho-CoA kinase
MLKIGLTGGIGSGKTTVSNLFKQEFLTPVLDADEISRNVLSLNTPAYFEVVQLFGPEAVHQDQQLNRQYIREVIFNDTQKRKSLEAIIHPQVRKEILAQAQRLTGSYCMIVIPLMIEANMTDLVDRICVIDTSIEQQVVRIQARDHCDSEQAMRILASQLDRETRLAHADDVITNNGSLNDLIDQSSKLHEKYLAICHQPTHN